MQVKGNIVNLLDREMFYGTVTIRDGKIFSIDRESDTAPGQPFILPGFIDAHIHIESSMLTPPYFAAMAVKQGTVATVSDPHEIANVCGIEGVRYMTSLGTKSGFKFFFGAPSCVPATTFETAGASLPLSDIRELFESREVHYLSEMMNYPAVLARDPLVMDKIALAREYGLPVDGHAPGLKGTKASIYAAAGITTDHECTSLDEALDKIEAGMHIIIREGSAAKNYTALHTLIGSHPDKVMFCSDDKHPDDLLRGHINELITRSLAHGYPLMDVLRIACVNPVLHYKLPVGLLRENDPADFIICSDLETFHIMSTWIDGKEVFDGKKIDLPNVKIPLINSFDIDPINASELSLILEKGSANIIVANDGAIVTERVAEQMESGPFEGDADRDILKIVVINRYTKSPPAIALIKGFGLKDGAIASSVAHDSHNIVAVGTNDEDLATCINLVIEAKGGVSASAGEEKKILELSVAGLMSPDDGVTVGHAYEALDSFVRENLGATLSAPYMTLSFMALLVIPSLKLSDLGLFDGVAFEFTTLQ